MVSPSYIYTRSSLRHIYDTTKTALCERQKPDSFHTVRFYHIWLIILRSHVRTMRCTCRGERSNSSASGSSFTPSSQRRLKIRRQSSSWMCSSMTRVHSDRERSATSSALNAHISFSGDCSSGSESFLNWLKSSHTVESISACMVSASKVTPRASRKLLAYWYFAFLSISPERSASSAA